MLFVRFMTLIVVSLTEKRVIAGMVEEWLPEYNTFIVWWISYCAS
jgi:hypothetical protein